MRLTGRTEAFKYMSITNWQEILGLETCFVTLVPRVSLVSTPMEAEKRDPGNEVGALSDEIRSKVKLFNVGSSFTKLISMEADGAPFTPLSLSVLRFADI